MNEIQIFSSALNNETMTMKYFGGLVHFIVCVIMFLVKWNCHQQKIKSGRVWGEASFIFKYWNGKQDEYNGSKCGGMKR